MDPKEVQRQFRAAAWPTPGALDVFVLGVDALPAGEILKLLGLLGDKALLNDAAAHRNRLQAFKRIVERAPDPQLFVSFARALKTADASTRALLVELLPKVNSVPGHSEVAALLKQPDVAVRRAAMAVLRNIAGKSVFDLCAALAREEHPGRAEAIELAATIGGYHSIPALEHVVINGKPPDRLLALKFLGDPRLMSKDVPSALTAISRALADPNEQIAVTAITSFGAICTEEDFHVQLGAYLDSSVPAIARAVVDAARRFPSPRTFAALERRFRIGPNALRLAVLNTLEAIGNDDSLPLLADALAIKHVPVRTRAGEVLSNLSLNKKLNLARTLLWLLRSRDVNVRRIAVDIAKRIGDPTGELWPSLLRFLRDEDWWVRERVMDALVEMAGTQLTRHVVSYLQDSSDVVRRYAVDVLMRLKDPAALGALVRTAMTDTDWWVRERSIESIALLQDQRAIPYIVDLMSKVDELRLACLSALAQMKATSAAPAVLGLLNNPDLDVRRSALSCLAQIGNAEHGSYVRVALNDVDHRVRNQAKDLLAQWNLSPLGTNDSGVFKAALTPLDRLLVQLAKVEGDDLILAAGRQPYVKRLGKVVPLEGTSQLSDAGMMDLLWPHLTEVQRESLGALHDIDFSYDVKTEGLRFRANVFRQQTGLGAVFRIIKDKLLTIDQLGLPPVVQTFGDLKNGLVLVGGPTGSGKSTTLAAIIDYINRTSARHIVSLEDPIEVLHIRKSSLVNQREVGTHTKSFSKALRSVLREDPDVLLVGEMRDLATISFAVSAAETGHLVFGTLHTVSADTTMDRLINAFPAGQQAQVRSMLAESMRAVVCQHLLRRADRAGRVLAVEVMLNNDAISNLIRKGKCFQIPSMIATGREQGMQSMDADLKRLLKEGAISADEAYMKANNKKEFEEIINGKDPNAPPTVPGLPPSQARPVIAGPAPLSGPPSQSRPAIGSMPQSGPPSQVRPAVGGSMPPPNPPSQVRPAPGSGAFPASGPPSQVRPAVPGDGSAPSTGPGSRVNIPRIVPR